MAVVVTDMDMPACCAVCEFRHPFANIGYLCKRKPDKPFVPNGLRPEWCPLAEVEQNKPVHLEEPEYCKECKSISQINEENWYCHMSAVLPENSQLDISTVMVDPEGKPEWCPITKINKQLDDLPPSKREKAWMIINGLSALFGNDNFLDGKRKDSEVE